MRTYLPTIAAVLTLAFALDWIAPGAVTAAAACGESDKAPPLQSRSVAPANNLRGVYYNPPEEGLVPAVGRLAVSLLTEEGGLRQVNLHHRFHTGESFQFMVSSNRDGWLYILHRSPGGEPQLLWPRVKTGEELRHLDQNQVKAGRDVLVPANPGKFTFDDEVGNEYFYVVIRPMRQPPELSAVVTAPTSVSDAVKQPPDTKAPSQARPADVQPSPPSTGQNIVQFSVRGHKHPIRGVVYDPGPQDKDPNTYFSSHPDDDSSDIIVEFKLLHEG